MLVRNYKKTSFIKRITETVPYNFTSDQNTKKKKVIVAKNTKPKEPAPKVPKKTKKPAETPRDIYNTEDRELLTFDPPNLEETKPEKRPSPIGNSGEKTGKNTTYLTPRIGDDLLSRTKTVAPLSCTAYCKCN